MSYFAHFSKLKFNNTDLRDITFRVLFIESIRDDDRRCSDYYVEDGETPESIAQDFYDDSQLDWVILNLNKIVDPFYDWHLDTNKFESMLYTVYGNPDDPVFYKVPDGRVFPLDHDFATYNPELDVDKRLITYREVEEDKNEAKRSIRVVRPDKINRVMDEFTELLRGIRA